jgi:hypothetical protein
MYERLGFSKIDGFVRLSVSRRTSRRPVRRARAPFPQFLRIDREAFGADRARLLRRVFREFPRNWAWVTEGRRVAGYSVVKEYQDSSEIGPAICRQPNRNQVRELISSSVALTSRWPLEMSVPESNLAAIQVATELGFRAVRNGLIMAFKQARPIAINHSVVALGFLDKG